MSATCGTSSAPCDLTTALRIASMHADRNVLKLGAGTYISAANNFPINIDTVTNLTIDARGATVHGNGNGAIFTINSGKGLTLLGGTVELAKSNGGGGSNGDGDGVACTGGGTFAAYETVLQNNDASGIDSNNCNIKLTSVYIHDNSRAGIFPGIGAFGGKVEISRSRIASQKGGGLNLDLNATFMIAGNVFSNNGDLSSAIGGVFLNTNAAGNHFDFNTVVNNNSKASGAAGGVTASVGSDFIASNNLIYGNSDPQANSGPYAYCDIGPTAVTGVSDGGNNISSAPMFKYPVSDFHPTAGSPVEGKADPNADLTGIAGKDINGVARTAPADLGAYVVPVP